MEQLEKDLLIIGKFKNAKLYDLMGGRTNAEVCREIGCDEGHFGALMNLKLSPFRKDGTYTPIAQKVADYFKTLPEDLFPTDLYALTLPKQLERRYSSQAVMLSLESREVRQLEAESPETTAFNSEMSGCIETMLRTLTPREARVIEMRFGLNGGEECTLSQVGEAFKFSVERVRQVEAKALRKLRHPSRTRQARPLLDGIRD